MAGNEKERVLLADRDLRLMKLLLLTRFFEAEQLQGAMGFGSLRRTNRRLLRLHRAGFLKRWFIANKGGAPKSIYGLSRVAARAIGEGRETLLDWKDGDLIVSSQFLAHQQAVNEVFFAVCGKEIDEDDWHTWTTFKESLSPAVPLRPDAYFELGEPSSAVFLEVDRGTEPLKTWSQKASLYLRLAASGEFERLFGKLRFRVAVVVVGDERLNNIRETVARQTEQLFWFSTLDRIRVDGFAHARWYRPTRKSEVSIL